MIRFRLTSLALATVLSVVALAQQPFRLVFANTELSAVLRAIGLRSGANIVYVGADDPHVTLNVTAGTTDEALRFASASAGVIFRRVGNTYVVAKPEDMRRALEPFGLRYRINLERLTPGEAVGALQTALPYLTIQPAGNQILVTGTRDDIDQAREIIKEQEERKNVVPPVTEILPVRVVGAATVAQVLGEMYPDIKIRVIAQEGAGGSLIITGPPASVSAARAMLGLIDTRNPLPGSEEIFKVYEIRYSAAQSLITFLSQAMPDVEAFPAPENYAPPAPGFRPLSGASVAGIGGTAGTGSTSGSGNIGNPLSGGGNQGGSQIATAPGERVKRIVLRGGRDRVEAAANLLTSLDVRPKQVMVEVKVVDYSPSTDSQVGFNWNWSSLNFYELPPGTGIDLNNPAAPIGPFDTFSTRPAGFGTFSRMPWNFGAVLNAMVTKKDARLLATPSVQVIDGESANIFIGDTIRARVSAVGSLGGQTVEIVEFPIGIILLIRPRVNANGDITLRVHPVVSTVTALDDNNVPQTSTREAETTLVIKNGETMVLGGLIRDEMSKTVREVPLLSQLPIVGELFRSTTKNGRKSEILVFVTPRLVDVEEGAKTAVQPEGQPAPAQPEKKP